jgi:hypothetical protein
LAGKEYLPAVQSWHTEASVALTEFENLPASQIVQLEAPISFENVPGGHCKQSDAFLDPRCGAYVPCGHPSQSVANPSISL